MQLVLEIDNPIIDINNKMAAVEQNSLLNKPITNGDISHIDETDEKINTDIADIKDNKMETVEERVKDKTLLQLETVSVDAEENVNKEAISENTPQSQLVITNKEIINNKENSVTESDLVVKETEDAQSDMVKENLQNAQDSIVQTDSEPMYVDCVNESLNDDICPVEGELNQSLSSMVANIVKDLEKDTKAEDIVDLDLKNVTSDVIQESKKDSIDSQVEIPANSIDVKVNEGNNEGPIINNGEESNHITEETILAEDKNRENIIQAENVSNTEKSSELTENNIASESANSETCMQTETVGADIEKSKLTENSIASENANSENCMQTETIGDAEIHMPLNKGKSIECEDPVKMIQTEDISDLGINKHLGKDKDYVECKDSVNCTQTEGDKEKNSVEYKNSADCTQTEDIGDLDMVQLNNDKVSGEGKHSADCNQDSLSVTNNDLDESKIEDKLDSDMNDSIEDFDLTKEAESTPVVNSIIQNDKAIPIPDEPEDSDMIDINEKRFSESKGENDVNVDIKEKTNAISGVDITEGDIQDIPNATTSDANEIVDLVGIDDISENKSNLPKDEASDKADKVVKPVIQLSNTLDILSDDEDSHKTEEKEKDSIIEAKDTDKQCINLDDDDDIMLIDEDESANKNENKEVVSDNEVKKSHQLINSQEPEKQVLPETKHVDTMDTAIEKSETKTEDISASPSTIEVKLDETIQKSEKSSPLIPEDFFKGYRKNLADMTRDDLEEFCLLKIVESIIDRSNLNEIRTKMKTMAVNIEDYKKKAMMLTKQNRDLQVVLKSIQEEQKKNTNQPIVPLKITRSVGMQVLMTDKTRKRHMPIPTPPPPQATNSNNSPVIPATNNFNRPTRSPSISTRSQKVVNAQIPVPRLVPAANTVLSKPQQVTANTSKNTPVQNGVKIAPLLQKAPEKRTHSRMQSQSSTQTQADTVDLTDDEPPSKVVANKNSPPQSVRLLYPASPNMVPRPQFAQTSNSPRKVYIPITGPGSNPQQAPPVRGQTIMLKTISSPSSKGKDSQLPMVRVPQNAVGVRRVQNNRHPAPLPLCSKQYQPPNWKSLPPAPDLKLSKVENGIVISWKIEGYREDSYEEIASYQLFAYQEPPGPPSTSLWKKIGDVKALPLPMACTLTQFMAGFKYYFAVRAVDIRSRFGPFSLPGSILLLNKM